MALSAVIPAGYRLVKVNDKTWVQTKDPDSVKPVITTNHSENDYKKKDGVYVLYEGLTFKSKKDLAIHLNISQSKLSQWIAKRKIFVKELRKKY